MALQSQLEIRGRCDARFRGVEEAFQKQLDIGFEVGAAVAAFVDGEAVVDLWAGHRDAARSQPWEEDTLACMMSTGKAMGCLCVLRLVDEGAIALDDPVARYWPEFAQAGKEALTIRQVLAHTSGLVYLDALEPGSMFDYPALRAAAEQQRPEWPPGTQPAYHPFTVGVLNRELVFRVTGRAIADYWREEFAEPLGADFQLALNEAEQARCAETISDPDDPFAALAGRTDNPIGRAWRAQAPGGLAGLMNTREGRTWGVPNVGFGNPRALAKVYGVLACGGSLGGVRLLSEALLAEATTEAWQGEDAVLGVPIRHGLGFLLSGGALRFTDTDDTFAGLGAGGYVGVGVRSRRLGFACVGNHMAHTLDEGPLSKALMSAVMDCF
jgi:CubicO group peptidase (beta-lactamase class C family)